MPNHQPACFFHPKMQSPLDKICKANYTKTAKQTLHHYIPRTTRTTIPTKTTTTPRRQKMKSKIPELRKKHKLSQEELATAVGVTRQTITSIECEKYTASLVLAYKIAKYFGLSIEEVFDFTELEEI
jgi:putative transcriptional regulator